MFARLRNGSATLLGHTASLLKAAGNLIITKLSVAVGKASGASGIALYGSLKSSVEIFHPDHRSKTGENVIKKLVDTGDIWLPEVYIPAIVFSGSTLIINSITRVPRIMADDAPQEEKEYEPLPTHKQILFDILLFFAACSGLFTGVGAFLGGVSTVDFLAALFDLDADDNLRYGYGFYICFSALYSYFVNNFVNTKHNLQEILHEEKWRDFDRKTIIYSTVDVVGKTFFAKFSTKHGFAKIPGIEVIPSNILTGIITFSTLTAFSTYAITGLSSVHDLREGRQVADISDSPKWRALYTTVKIVGGPDSVGNGFSTFVGVTDTLNEEYGFDPRGYMLVIAIPCALASAYNNYANQDIQAFWNTARRFFPTMRSNSTLNIRGGAQAYAPVSTDPDRPTERATDIHGEEEKVILTVDRFGDMKQRLTDCCQCLFPKSQTLPAPAAAAASPAPSSTPALSASAQGIN